MGNGDCYLFLNSRWCSGRDFHGFWSACRHGLGGGQEEEIRGKLARPQLTQKRRRQVFYKPPLQIYSVQFWINKNFTDILIKILNYHGVPAVLRIVITWYGSGSRIWKKFVTGCVSFDTDTDPGIRIQPNFWCGSGSSTVYQYRIYGTLTLRLLRVVELLANVWV